MKTKGLLFGISLAMVGAIVYTAAPAAEKPATEMTLAALGSPAPDFVLKESRGAGMAESGLPGEPRDASEENHAGHLQEIRG